MPDHPVDASTDDHEEDQSRPGLTDLGGWPPFLDDGRTADDIRIDRLLDSDPRNNPALEQTSTPRFSVAVTVTLDHHRIAVRAIGRLSGNDLNVIRALVDGTRSLQPGRPVTFTPAANPFVRLTTVGELIDEWRLTADELHKIGDTPAADALALAADELEAATGTGRADNPVTAIQRVADEIGWPVRNADREHTTGTGYNGIIEGNRIGPEINERCEIPMFTDGSPCPIPAAWTLIAECPRCRYPALRLGAPAAPDAPDAPIVAGALVCPLHRLQLVTEAARRISEAILSSQVLVCVSCGAPLTTAVDNAVWTAL